MYLDPLEASEHWLADRREAKLLNLKVKFPQKMPLQYSKKSEQYHKNIRHTDLSFCQQFADTLHRFK